MHKELGKISKVTIGNTGYQEAMFGIDIWVQGAGWGSCLCFTGGWNMDPSPSAKWTVDDRDKKNGEAFNKLRLIMKDFKVKEFRELEGKPIEATFESPLGSIISIRPLTEVM